MGRFRVGALTLARVGLLLMVGDSGRGSRSARPQQFAGNRTSRLTPKARVRRRSDFVRRRSLPRAADEPSASGSQGLVAGDVRADGRAGCSQTLEGSAVHRAWQRTRHGLTVRVPNEGGSDRAPGNASELRIRGESGFAWRGEAKQQGEANHFIGNDPKKWLTHLPQFGRVEAQGPRGVGATGGSDVCGVGGAQQSAPVDRSQRADGRRHKGRYIVVEILGPEEFGANADGSRRASRRARATPPKRRRDSGKWRTTKIAQVH
jgi:hypothetical protein